MSEVLIDARRYRYVGRQAPALRGKTCYGYCAGGTASACGEPGRGRGNALVWFPEYGLVNVPFRTLRRVRPAL